jgi:hypothetical protein
MFANQVQLTILLVFVKHGVVVTSGDISNPMRVVRRLFNSRFVAPFRAVGETLFIILSFFLVYIFPMIVIPLYFFQFVVFVCIYGFVDGTKAFVLDAIAIPQRVLNEILGFYSIKHFSLEPVYNLIYGICVFVVVHLVSLKFFQHVVGRARFLVYFRSYFNIFTIALLAFICAYFCSPKTEAEVEVILQSRKTNQLGEPIRRAGKLQSKIDKAKYKKKYVAELIEAPTSPIIYDNSLLSHDEDRDEELCSEEDPLFPHGWRGKTLPQVFAHMRIKDIPAIAGAIAKWDPDSTVKNSNDRLRYKDLLRRLSAVVTEYQDSANHEELREIIYDVYADVPVATFTRDVVYDLPIDYTTVKEVEIYCDTFNPDLFKTTTTRKGVVKPATLTLNEGPNELFDYFSKLETKNKMLFPMIIKSIVRTSKTGRTHEEVLDIFRKKMYLWRECEAKVRPPVAKLAWALPYIPPEIFYYGIGDGKIFFTQFRVMLSTLQGRILTYVRKYMEMGELSRKEIHTIYDNRKEEFRNIMRTPEIQLMFLQGFSKDFITDLVYRRHHAFLDREMMKDKIMTGHNAEKVYRRETERSAARDTKFSQQNDFSDIEVTLQSRHIPIFQPQSRFSTYFRPLPIFLGVWFSCIIMYFSEFITAATTTFAVWRKAATVKDEVEEWFTYLSNPLKEVLSEKYQPVFLEVKSIVHACYYFSKGQKFDATMWLTNFLFTRPAFMRKIMMSPSNLRQFLTDKRGRSEDFRAEEESFAEDAQQQDVPRSMPFPTHLSDPHSAAATSTEFRPESKEIFDMVSLFTTYFREAGMSHIRDEDVRSANARFTFLQNQSKKDDKMMSTLTTVALTLLRLVFGFDPLDKGYQSHLANMLEISAFVDKLNITEDSKADRALLLKTIKVCSEGNLLLDDPKMVEMHSYCRTRFATQMAKLNVQARAAVDLLRGVGTRKEPLFILFTGPPKVGKSSAINFLKRSIDHFDGEEYSEGKTYTYSGSEYWEGYAHQKYCVMDDLFKVVDVSDRAVQASAIIDMVNNVPFSLNMAFAEKGACFFDSQYIFGTTNIANRGIRNTEWQVGLTDDKAMLRRFHIVVHREEVIGNDLASNTFIVHKCDFKPEFIDKVITVKQLAILLRQCRQEQERQISAYAMNQTDIANIFEGVDTEAAIELQAFSYKTLDPILFIRELSTSLQNSSMFTTTTAISLFIGLFVVLVTLLKAKDLFSFFYPEVVETQSFDQGVKTGKRMARPNFSRKAAYYAKIDVKPESSIENYHRALNNNVSTSLFSVSTCYPAEDGNYVNETCLAIHLRDRYVCTPAHFYYKHAVANTTSLNVIIGGAYHTIPWPAGIRPTGGDFVVFKLPPDIKPGGSAYRYLPGIDDLELLETTTPMSLITLDENLDVKIRDTQKSDYNDPVRYTCLGDQITLDFPVTYDLTTQEGDSGGIVTASMSQGKPLFYGMHLGSMRTGKRQIGLAMILFKEAVDEVIRELDPGHLLGFPHVALKHVTAEMSHYPPQVSRLHPSKLFKWHDRHPHKCPAHLSTFTNADGEKVNPMFVAMRKQHQGFTVATEIPETVMDYLRYLYPKDCEARVLTLDEALRGTDNEDSLPIKLGTSPGYPYTKKHTGSKGKEPFIYRDDNQILQFLPSTRVEIERDMASLLRGEQIDVLWAATLKDELRLREKVEAGKTRLFSTCPLNFLILVRAFFLDFVVSVQSKAHSHPVSVGIAPDSVQWRALFNRLNSKGSSIVAGDFSNYDGMLPKFVGVKFARFVNDWYDDGPENSRARLLLLEHIWSAKHICYTAIYQVSDGNPSGNPITSIYNSFCNIIMCATILMEDLHLSPSSFELAVYGDDNVLAIDSPGITCNTLAPFFKSRFGMEYTHFSKVATLSTDTLFSIRYLGRAFFIDSDGFMRAPLSMDIIEDIPCYYQGDNERSVLIDGCASMFREISHYGAEAYRNYCIRFLSAVRSKRPELFDSLSKVALPYSEHVSSMYYKRDPKVISVTLQSKTDIKTRVYKPFWSFSAEPKIYASTITSRNEDQTAKAVNTSEETQAVQLGGYSDSAPIVSSSTNSEMLQDMHRGFNAEVFSMDHSLSRESDLGLFTWTTAAAAGTQVAYFDFPGSLFTKPYIREKIHSFAYFRAGIRMSIRISASSFLYGKLMLFYVPNPADERYQTKFTNIFQASGYPHVLISAAASEAAVLDVPFIYPGRMMDTDEAAPFAMGRFYLVVLNPLKDVMGNVGSANVFATAQFLDPELALPHDQVALQSKKEKISVEARLGCGVTIPVPTIPRSLDFHYAGCGRIIPMVTNSPPPPKKEKEPVVFQPQSKVEARLKSKMGVVSSDLVKSTTESASLSFKRTMRPYADIFHTALNTAVSAATTAAIMALDKPTTVAASQPVKLSVTTGFATGRGVDYSEKFAMDPENVVTCNPVAGGVTLDEMELSYVMGTPMLLYTATFVQGTPVTKIGDVTAYDYNMTYLDFVRRQFANWWGSVKFKGYITASTLHSVRFVVYLNDLAAETDWENCYHQVIDVQGDTEFSFTIPYTSKFLADTPAPTTKFSLFMKILSWSQPVPAVSSPVYVNIYKAGDSDMRVAKFLEQEFTVQSNVRKDFSEPFKPFHPSFTGFEHTGIVFGEEHRSIRDIVHRPAAYRIQNNAAFPTWSVGGTTSANKYTGLEMWGLIYTYYRGGVRVKLARKENSITGLFLYADGVPMPGLDVCFTGKPMLEAEIPWYQALAYHPTTVAGPTLLTVKCPSTVASSFLWKSAADDFSFLFLSPPPYGNFGNVSDVTQGLTGAATFYAT